MAAYDPVAAYRAQLRQQAEAKAAELRRTAETEARAQLAPVRRQVEAAVREALPPLPSVPDMVSDAAKKLGLPALPAGIPTTPEQAGRMLAAEAAKKLGLPPGFPITNPQQIPIYAARQLVSELGIPIPTKLDADSLLKAARALPIKLPFPIPLRIPGSAREALNDGLMYAAQLFGPQLMAAVGLGAAVPGVGWISSAGAILYSLLATYMASPPPRSRYYCWPSPGTIGPGLYPGAPTFMGQFPKEIWGGKWPGGRGAGASSPILLMAWAQATLLEARRIQGTPRAKGFIPAMLAQCITNQQQLIRYRLSPLVPSSIDQGTAGEVLGVLAMFDWLRGHYPGARFESKTDEMIAQLGRRATGLHKLVVGYQRVVALPPARDRTVALARLGRVMALYKLTVDEMRIGAAAVQRSQDDYWRARNLEQFAHATSMMAQLEQLRNELVKISQAGRKQFPATPAGHAAEMERWLREEGQHDVAPKPPPPAPTRTLNAAGQHCAVMLKKWSADNPQKARCLSLNDRQKLYDLCYRTFGTKTLSPAESFRQIQLVVAQACARAGARA